MTGMLLILLALGAIAVMAFGRRRFNAHPGLLVFVVASAVSFVPGLPRLELDPELILGVVVPPLLYAATLEVSAFRFMSNLRSIIGLGVTLVVVTAVVTTYVTHWLLPALGLGTAFVLGAIVAPPDTVTITAHGDEIGLPRRVTAILTGESLVNDAAALTLFALAVSWAGGEKTLFDNPVLLFLYSAVSGIVLGIVVGIAATVLRTRLGDPTLETALGLVLPFATFLLAESIHASGILAVVMVGFNQSIGSAYGAGRGNDLRVNYRTRMREREVWPVVGSLLEVFAFAYTGLQLRFVVDDLRESGEPAGRTVVAGLVVLLVVVLVRFAWVSLVFGRAWLQVRAIRHRLANDPEWRARYEARQAKLVARGRRPREIPEVLGWRDMTLVSWTGMRGIVTLGAAGGIPLLTEGGEPFPHRTTLQFVAYLVVAATLLLQGPTLPSLVRWLGVDTSAEDRAAAADLERAFELSVAVSGYDAQREAMSLAVREREIDDETARVVLEWIDRQESAAAEPRP